MLSRLILLFAALTWGVLSAEVPTPESHFGHPMGADRTVLDWERVVSYFHLLEQNSDSISVQELGKTTEGRPFIAATIASPQTLKRLDDYLKIQQRLADPRGLPLAQAEELIAQGKTVVMITCSIHATEIGSTHAAVQFVYRLLTEDNPRFRKILSDTVFILVPSLNPDGMDLVTEWYRKTLRTPFEGTDPPQLYQKYIGHDNNRDWYIFSQQETKLSVTKLHNVWHPQIIYDVHEMGSYGARMFVPPWRDPIDPNIDPILVQECNAIGAGIAMDLTASGKKGVLINAMYDFWSPARHYQAYHGGMRILSEAAGARIASPITVRPDEIALNGAGYNPRQSSWNYLEDWQGGRWSLGDIVDYELTAMESVLYQAALRREDLLRNFYRIGVRTIERESPYAFVVPSPQRDPGATRKLLETLAFGQVEIERAEEAFKAEGKEYAAGTYVIRMRQPYSSFAKTLLERQKYPDLRLYPGGPPLRPYDVTAHTLPLLMGVEVDIIEAPFKAKLRGASQFHHESGPSPMFPASDTDSWRTVNLIWASGGDVWREPSTGDFYATASGKKNLRLLRRPRIGLYKSYVPSIDEGWSRWLLEQFGFSFSSLSNDEIRAGGLRQRFDVLLFPDQSAASILTGFRTGEMPDEFVGGLGEPGAQSLQQFASEGGTVIFLNSSCDYATEHMNLKVKNRLRGIPSTELYSPGSLLNVAINTSHPLALGLPRQITIWSERSPAWQIEEPTVCEPVARYLRSKVLASGWLLGEEHLTGRVALLDYSLGKGHVILFGMKPQYRGQSYQTFKLLFNAFVR